MAKKKTGRKVDLVYEGSAANGEHHQHDQHENGFAGLLSQQPPVPPMHPMAPPPKKAKHNHRDGSIQELQTGSRPASALSASANYPNPRRAPRTVAPPLPQRSTAAQPNPLMQNPYSTSRGLRHFSMKVCEKVEEKGTTTYNEVADELVRELNQAEEAINKAAIARGEVPIKKKIKKPTNGKSKKNHDDKNIRRRVYDALNVLMAMDIITKDKKEITWRGLPGRRVQDHLGDGSGDDKRNVNGLSRRQRVQQLQDELAKRQEDIRRKRDCLKELMLQNVCFQNLLGRNHAREVEEMRHVSAPNMCGEDAHDDKCDVKEIKNEKIPLPFIIVSTDSKAVVQCEMCPERTNVSFDFSLPFEINDDNEILKKLGMGYTSREALQRSLPPDLFHYSNMNGLLEHIARPR